MEVVGPGAADPSLHARWRERIEHGRRLLDWADAPIVVRPHPGGATLAFAAPVDQLFCATELNEWAWLVTVGVAEFPNPSPTRYISVSSSFTLNCGL